MMFIVVPAYNEEKTIGRVVRGLFEHGHQSVIVVDDGSSDETANLAEAAGALVVRHEINRGQGAALQTGNEFALGRGATVVVHFDGDEQFNPKDIKTAVAMLMATNADVVLGSRFLDSRSRIPWFKKHALLPVGRWINYVFTKVKLSDAHNGFRVLNRRALETIVISQDRMAHNSDIVRQIRAHQLKVVECPVEVSYYEYGQGTLDGVKIVVDLVYGFFISK